MSASLHHLPSPWRNRDEPKLPAWRREGRALESRDHNELEFLSIFDAGVLTAEELALARDLAHQRGEAERQKWLRQQGAHRAAEPSNDTEPQATIEPVVASLYAPRDPAAIPPRPWVYGRQLLRGSLSLLIAPGASGKTSLLATTALALATGNPLVGYEVHGGPQRTWLWNLEDGGDELARLVEASRLHYMIEPDAIGDRLFVDSGLDGAELCLAKQRPGKSVELAEATFRAIEAEIVARKIDVLIVDPWVSAHLAQENDNGAQDAIAKRLARLAVNANCAVLVAHHSTKLGGAEVTAEKARGASALVNAARSVVTINRLAPTDAPKIGVPVGRHARYFRLYDDKANRAPPATASDWFELVSVDLGNGDNLPVVQRYHAPEVEVPEIDPSEVRDALGGEAWRESKQSPKWGGYLIAKRLDLDVGDHGIARSAEQVFNVKIVEGLITRALAEGSIERVQLPDEARRLKGFIRAAAQPAQPCSTS